MLSLTKDCVNLATPELWHGCIRQAMKYEEKFWQRDRMIERSMEELVSNPNLVIRLTSSDDETSSESGNCETSDESEMEIE